VCVGICGCVVHVCVHVCVSVSMRCVVFSFPKDLVDVQTAFTLPPYEWLCASADEDACSVVSSAAPNELCLCLQNMRSPQFRTDERPISGALPCSCYTCGHHSRAYIYHLISTQEMLHSTLLMIHNVHQYALFFEYIRRALSQGCYALFCERVLHFLHRA
jgi:Queuine tRNA-ribosyltransferase